MSERDRATLVITSSLNVVDDLEAFVDARIRATMATADKPGQATHCLGAHCDMIASKCICSCYACRVVRCEAMKLKPEATAAETARHFLWPMGPNFRCGVDEAIAQRSYHTDWKYVTCEGCLKLRCSCREIQSADPSRHFKGCARRVEREADREVTFVHGGDSGWTRIGRYDSARRRSLWCRLVGEDEMGNVQAIELCSGREGDDAYVKLTPADPQWEDLCDLLLRVRWDCGLEDANPPAAKPPEPSKPAAAIHIDLGREPRSPEDVFKDPPSFGKPAAVEALRAVMQSCQPVCWHWRRSPAECGACAVCRAKALLSEHDAAAKP